LLSTVGFSYGVRVYVPCRMGVGGVGHVGVYERLSAFPDTLDALLLHLAVSISL
jgi:hypothetical protein